MSGSKRGRTTTYQPPLPPRWKGRDSLEMVHQLNERALTLLSRALSEREGPWPQDPDARALWANLGAEEIQRAARFPFVILDACFTDEVWWRTISANLEHTFAGAAMASAWPPKEREELFSELLVLAWHTVRWDRRVARLSLGVLPGVAEVLAALTPHQLATISARHADALQLRWQEDREFWIRLLVAARDRDEKALSDIQLHAKLLLSGPLVAGRGS